jgi:peptidoglycan endopeptidase LytE
VKKFYLFIANLALVVFITGNIYAATTYISKSGDTPGKIAAKFKVSLRSVIKTNNLKSGKLKPGTRLTIPARRKSPAGNRNAGPKCGQDGEGDAKDACTTSMVSVPHEDVSFHIVKKGETLSSISQKYSVSISELKKLNKIVPRKLKVGRKILIHKHTPEEYLVRKGDTLWKIAGRFGVSPDELRNINGLETDLLKPGRKILLKAKALADESRTASRNSKDGEEVMSESGPEGPKTYDTALAIEADKEKQTIDISVTDNGKRSLQDRLVLFAKKLLDIPYRFGGNSPLGIDCSAYVKKVYSLIGVDLPRTAREQFHEGRPVSEGELNIGDLVFFRTYASFPSHVGIYLGNNLFIHASSRARKVTIDSLNTPFYLRRFIGAKRLLDMQDEYGTVPEEH